jgi:hypothetical protein
VACGTHGKVEKNVRGFGVKVRMIVNCARQLCSGIHKVQEGVGQGTHGDELH